MVCVMVCVTVQPAFAWFEETKKEQDETLDRATWGWIGGAVVGTIFSVASLGLTLPVVAAGAAAGGAIGMVYNGANEKQKDVVESGGMAATILGLVKWLATVVL